MAQMHRVPTYNITKKSFFWYKLIPAILTIAMATAPIWTSLLGIYDLLIIYLAFLATYILYKSTQQTISNWHGYNKMQKHIQRDWRNDLLELEIETLNDRSELPDQKSDLRFLLFIPIYKEPFEFLDSILQTLADQDYPYMDKVIPVLAVEDRAGDEQKKIITTLKEKHSKNFGDIWVFYHPEGIPGEIVGDACSNLRWAGIQASKKLQELHINSKHVLFNKADSDTRFHPKFLSALAYSYLTADKRNNKFYSPAVLIYSNNYWKVPGLTRVFSASLTLGIINEWLTEKHRKQSFSCYASNFRLLERTNFWDATTGAEDTYFFWNAFLYLNGNFSGECFWLPITMDAVEGKSLAGAFKSLYKQQLRWGWGVLIMPLSIQGMLWNKRIKLGQKIDKILLLARSYNFVLTISTLLTFSMPLLTVLNKELEYSSVTYLLPRIISYMMTASLLFQIPSKYYLWRFYGAPPKEKSIWFKIWWWGFEHFLMFINVWTYYLLPRIQAQYELAFSKKREKFFVSIEGTAGEDKKSA